MMKGVMKWMVSGVVLWSAGMSMGCSYLDEDIHLSDEEFHASFGCEEVFLGPDGESHALDGYAYGGGHGWSHSRISGYKHRWKIRGAGAIVTDAPSTHTDVPSQTSLIQPGQVNASRESDQEEDTSLEPITNHDIVQRIGASRSH